MSQSPNKRSPVKKSSPPGTNVTKVMVQQPPRPNVIYRRKGEQNQNGGVAMHGGVAKRVSGEFDYGRHNLNRRSSSDYGLMIRENSQISEGPAHQQNKATPSAPPPAVVRVQCNYNNNVNKGQRPKSMAFPGSSPDVVRGAVTPSASNGPSNAGPSKEGVASQQQQQLSRPMGLGRRAVTQINIKKNSYGSAMCKSQENLVKVRTNLLKYYSELQFVKVKIFQKVSSIIPFVINEHKSTKLLPKYSQGKFGIQFYVTYV